MYVCLWFYFDVSVPCEYRHAGHMTSCLAVRWVTKQTNKSSPHIVAGLSCNFCFVALRMQLIYLHQSHLLYCLHHVSPGKDAASSRRHHVPLY